MTAEQRRCRLVVVGTALKYLTRDAERAAQRKEDAQELPKICTVTMTTSPVERADEELRRIMALVHEANEMVRELKEMEVTE